jgi:hypothetical protein
MPALRVEMTHGDKAKAKAGRKSQASVKERSAKGGENGKGSAKGAGKVTEAVKAVAKSGVVKAAKQAVSGKKDVAPSKSGPASSGPAGTKGVKASATKERSGESDSRAKARGGNEGGAPIADTRLATAFKHAIAKYPNAFRKLTD